MAADKKVKVSSTTSGGALGFDDEHFMEEIRLQMTKFAQLQLGEHALAEDAVQEAFIGAMQNAKSFAGKSAFKTWVFAILKNKIADILRKRHRQMEVNNLDSSNDDQFDDRGHWEKQAAPSHWGNPERTQHNEEFWLVFETCLNNLPETQGKVFMMREYLGLDSEEICSAEGLTVSNLHVLLYRARLRLQRCLEKNWFGGKKHA